MLRPLEDIRQQQVLIELARQVRASEDGRPDHRVLGANEMKTLDDSRLVEIGSHTVTHAVLSSQPRDVRRGEIVRSKEYLEEILGHPVNLFPIPMVARRMWERIRSNFRRSCYSEVSSALASPFSGPRLGQRGVRSLAMEVAL